VRSIRKISLQNAAGERYGLNGDRGAYATGLAGFGFTLTPTYADLKRGFFVPVSDEAEPQSALAFTAVFTTNAYAAYEAFVSWISAAGTVTVVYNPTGAQEYYRDVTVNFVQKGERNAVGWLEVPLSFFCNTPWYRPSPTSLSLEAAGVDESKRYDYEYTDSLIYGADSSAGLYGDIVGAGHVPGALELTYRGAITNPKIRLTGEVSGKTYGICSVAAVLSDTDSLKLSTRYEDSYIVKISAGGIETDLLDVLDLSTTPFFHIPVDEPCTLSIEADAPFTGVADLLIFYYYRSV
jgi:hypothetical protein